MRKTEKLLYEGDSDYDHYQVVEMMYTGRPARVLFSGKRSAAQSGIALDDKSTLLFDYNQRFYELVLSKLPKRLLIIGGGTYTLPAKLHEVLPNMEIDIIEPDQHLDELAIKYFDYHPHQNLRIIHQDGRSFLERNTITYDMVLIDAFSDTTIPRSLSTLQAVTHIHRSLSPNGIAAINVISAYYGIQAAVLRRQTAAYQASFKTIEIYPADSSFSLWTSQNFILTGIKDNSSVAPCMRYKALDPLNAAIDEALQDE